MFKKLSQFIVIATMITLILGTFMNAQAAPLIFSPVADSYVREAGPNSNYSKKIKLWVQAGTNANYETNLSFVVSGLSEPIQSATLRLYATSGTVDGPAIYSTTNNWTETGITWNTRPARTSVGLDDKGAIVSNSWVEYNVTPLVTGNGTYSFVLVSTSTDSVSFSSREGGQPPQLVLSFGSGITSTNTPTVTSLSANAPATPFAPAASSTPIVFITSTTLSRPGYLQPIIDPVFGSRIIRVVDDSWGSICRHHYSKDQAWNADQTVIWLNKGCDKFIDGNTYALLPNLKFPPDSGGESRWHPTDPKAIIYVSHDTLGKWNPFTGDNVILHVFPGYTDLTIGLSEGNLSNDGNMIALYSASAKKGFVYDIAQGIKYPEMDFSNESNVDFLSVSPLGKYMIANVNNDNTKIFDLQGNQVGATWSTYGCPSHYDLTLDLNGDEVAVGVCKTGYNGIIKRRLSDGKITVIFPMGASHTSARNIRRPGWVYVTGLYYAPYLNEILAIKLDGAAFEQIAFILNDNVSYVTEMHGSSSPDGKKVIVASNWGISAGPAQSYVVETATSMPAPTNTPTFAPTIPATSDSGISGQVWIRPTCPGPINPGNSACADKPYQATLTVLTLSGQEVIHFATDAQGQFRVNLAPGQYILHPESLQTLPYSKDQLFTVITGQFTQLAIYYDTGVR